MTRKEAISQLKTDGCHCCAYGCETVVDCTNESCEYKEAFLMAIKSLERDEKYAELRKRVQEFMMKENMFSINSRDFDDNFFDTAESEDKE